MQILKPIARLGGITYGRLVEGLEIPRPDFEETVKTDGAEALVKPKTDDQ